ncbi:antitoxin VbhA family protein [Helcococcus ovis]|uniref:antitoxin VbhA family protein n=1 Tax=Helcococcus ovis TaxID=72026 RepID=UPI001ADA38A3|nr:antitoxin VbhA family protein [Helcococcus ovis]
MDGLKTSDYLVENAVKNIDGEISIQDVQDLMKSYYEEKPDRGQARTREADSVSVKITKLIYENSFSLSPGEVISIHKELFENFGF